MKIAHLSGDIERFFGGMKTQKPGAQLIGSIRTFSNIQKSLSSAIGPLNLRLEIFSSWIFTEPGLVIRRMEYPIMLDLLLAWEIRVLIRQITPVHQILFPLQPLNY